MANTRVTIEDLYENKLLASKINTFIDDGKTLEFITSFANSQGVSVSLGTIRNYKKLSGVIIWCCLVRIGIG